MARGQANRGCAGDHQRSLNGVGSLESQFLLQLTLDRQSRMLLGPRIDPSQRICEMLALELIERLDRCKFIAYLLLQIGLQIYER